MRVILHGIPEEFARLDLLLHQHAPEYGLETVGQDWQRAIILAAIMSTSVENKHSVGTNLDTARAG